MIPFLVARFYLNSFLEKVLAVNPGDQNVIDNIDTFWNAAIASNSVSSSPQEDRMSPKQEKRSGTPSGNNEENIDVTGKPIVIQVFKYIYIYITQK